MLEMWGYTHTVMKAGMQSVLPAKEAYNILEAKTGVRQKQPDPPSLDLRRVRGYISISSG